MNYLPCTGAAIIIVSANRSLTGVTIAFSRSYVRVTGVSIRQCEYK